MGPVTKRFNSTATRAATKKWEYQRRTQKGNGLVAKTVPG